MTDRTQSLLLGLVTIFCWGSIATLGNLLIHLPPFYVLGISFLLGALPALQKPRELFPSLGIFALGLFGYFGYHFFLFYSFRFAPPVEANLINYMWPVLMVMISPLFFKEERLYWYNYVGAILAIIGCILLVTGGAEESRSGQEYIGYLLAAGAAITWPLYSIGKKKMAKTSMWAVGGFCLGASFLSFGTHYFLEPRVTLTMPDAWKLIAMGFGPFGIALYCWDKACQKGDTRVLGALAYLTPVISTLGLVFFANQILTPISGVAMVLITGGATSGLVSLFPSKVLKKEH